MLSNCGHDENNKYSGGAAGDQTGKEWRIIPYNTRSWDYVLRHPDPKVRELLAKLSEEAADNNCVGYDQGQRLSYWEQLKRVGYRPANIVVKCEADCSSGVAANIKAVGYLLGIKALQDLNASCYTGNLRAAAKKAGFEILTDKKYLTSDKYLLRGDLPLDEGHHVATNLTDGSATKSTSKPTSNTSTTTVETKGSGYMFEPKTVKKGCKGTSVLLVQEILKARGYVGADGKPLSLDQDCGNNTVYAINKYQSDRRSQGKELGTNGKNDGTVGKKMWADLIAI